MDRLNFEEDFRHLFGLWADLFKPFMESEEAYNIYQTLKEDGSKTDIVPGSDNVFRVFSTTDPNNIRNIWYLMDPYPRRYRALPGEKKGKFQGTGIAMDCSNSPDGKIQPSLEKFYDAVHKDTKKKPEYNPDLSYLGHQGVMLINSDLTCKVGKTGSHDGLWKPFQKFFLQEIMASRIDIPYVLSGKVSEKMEEFINPFAKIYKLEHPSFAERMHRDWDHKSVFQKINQHLREIGKEEIIWDSKAYYDKLSKELPF